MAPFTRRHLPGMVYLCGGQCWVTVRGYSLRSQALMGYMCRGQYWVTVRSAARFAGKHLLLLLLLFSHIN